MSTEDMNSASAPAEGARGRIVVGVDGSASASGALRHAAELAKSLDADLLAVTVWHFPRGYTMGPVMDWSPEPDAQKTMDTVVERAFGGTPPRGLRTQVVEGPTVRTLIDMSKGALMLVVGSRGHGGFAGMVLGSVSSACAEYAHCPVLVHPDTAAAKRAA